MDCIVRGVAKSQDTPEGTFTLLITYKCSAVILFPYENQEGSRNAGGNR